MSASTAFVLGAVIGMLVVACVAVIWIALHAAHMRKIRTARIQQIAGYLESAATGRAAVLSPTGEDDLSRLQDEIGKTVTALHRTRGQAVRAKEGYARNLSYIAHQIKTPLAVLSLAAQRMEREGDDRDVRAILAQIERLERLQEDLLLMAKLDAGVLKMSFGQQDVLTLLSVAVDDMAELADKANVVIEVVDNGPLEIRADGHWMCEALMNVLKNCIEHSPAGGTVRIEYASNPLYAEIVIVDEGEGFKAGEEKRAFQRFYTGGRGAFAGHRIAEGRVLSDDRGDRGAFVEPGVPGGRGPFGGCVAANDSGTFGGAPGGVSSGTGLGLAFARELLELQNGTIRASDRPDGGARFDIRIYCHPNVTSAS